MPSKSGILEFINPYINKYYSDERPLIIIFFSLFTISTKLPKSRMKPGKPVYIRLSGLRLH